MPVAKEEVACKFCLPVPDKVVLLVKYDWAAEKVLANDPTTYSTTTLSTYRKASDFVNGMNIEDKSKKLTTLLLQHYQCLSHDHHCGRFSLSLCDRLITYFVVVHDDLAVVKLRSRGYLTGPVRRQNLSCNVNVKAFRWCCCLCPRLLPPSSFVD